MLLSVPRPLQYLVFKIPLIPTDLGTADASNNAAAFPSVASKLVNVGLPTSGPTTMSLDGLPVFPPYNDNSGLAWASCEMDGCNAHVGQGFDYHYHGDPFGSTITNTTCVYSINDYATTLAHPPLIGYSLDGFKLYGRYLDSGAPGATTALDVCGGHTHSGVADSVVGYHYHSQVVLVNNTVDGSYLAYPAGPYNCWRGNISASECATGGACRGEVGRG